MVLLNWQSLMFHVPQKNVLYPQMEVPPGFTKGTYFSPWLILSFFQQYILIPDAFLIVPIFSPFSCPMFNSLYQRLIRRFNVCPAYLFCFIWYSHSYIFIIIGYSLPCSFVSVVCYISLCNCQMLNPQILDPSRKH